MKPNSQVQKALKTSQVEWSESKFHEMQSQLQGYWQQEIWSPHENPLRNRNKDYKGIGACLRFNECPEIIKTEIKFACYQKIINQEWSIETLHYNASKINRICEWLKEKHSRVESIVNKPLEEWLLSIRTYLTEIGKYSSELYRVQGYLKKNGEAQTYKAENDCLDKFTQIYRCIIDFYDDRDEYEKDIWDLRRLGFTDKYVVASHQHLLNFTELKDSWFYNATQKFIKYKLPLVSSQTCNRKLLSIREFSKFLNQVYPSIKSSEVNRSIILDYLGYLATLKISNWYRHDHIANLRDFLELSFREKWLDIVGDRSIYDDDLPKYKRSYNPDYIPEEVIDQIYQHLDKIKNPMYMRMFLILIECGMRISELCYLKFDCLKQVNHDNYLYYYQFKFKKDHSIPISEAVVKVIQEQQNYVRNKVGKDCPYLFPSSKHKAQYKAVSSRPFCNTLKILIYQQDIRDNHGVLWQFHSHQCRHTVGTRLINNGVPYHIVQRYLGHESPTMTQVYAHVHDSTLRKEIEKYHEARVVNFQGETVELEETILSSNNDLEWFKKTIQARALEHGYCARPKILGDCDIPGFDGCYNCPFWRTNKNFLSILKDTLDRTDKVIEKARNCGWELQVKKNEPRNVDFSNKT